MIEILKKLKLADSFTLELPIDKQTFIERFNKRVEPSELGIFSSFFEGLSSNNSRYKGKVDRSGFKLRLRKGLSRYKQQKAIAEGDFEGKNDSLIIEVSINGMDITVYLSILALVILNILVGLNILPLRFEQGAVRLAVLFFFWIFYLVMTYFTVRKSVKEIQEDLIDCFSKIVKQKVVPKDKNSF